MSAYYTSTPSAQEKRGRKPASESRAGEIRAKLLEWKQTPEPQRISLRALATELGTSHQLLSHYLKTWDCWQEKEYRRSATEIRARGISENRPLTQWEQVRADAYQREAFQVMLTRTLDSGLNKILARLRAGGSLSRQESRFVNLAARKGIAVAHKVLAICSQNGAKKSENNLPLGNSRAAKPFRSVTDKVATPLK